MPVSLFFSFLSHPANTVLRQELNRLKITDPPLKILHTHTYILTHALRLRFALYLPRNFFFPSVEWHVKEGEVLKPIQTCAHVYGPVRQILIGERTALNLIARCSGIASQAHRLRVLKEKNGFKGLVAGTRKTTPGKAMSFFWEN